MKPCPFCGEKEKLKIKRYPLTTCDFIFTIKCKACGAEGPASNSDKDAELEWNVRPENEVEKEIQHRIDEGKLIPAERLEEIRLEVKKLCDLICNSSPDTKIKGEIEARAFELGQHPYILNHINGEKK